MKDRDKPFTHFETALQGRMLAGIDEAVKTVMRPYIKAPAPDSGLCISFAAAHDDLIARDGRYAENFERYRTNLFRAAYLLSAGEENIPHYREDRPARRDDDFSAREESRYIGLSILHMLALMTRAPAIALAEYRAGSAARAMYARCEQRRSGSPQP